MMVVGRLLSLFEKSGFVGVELNTAEAISISVVRQAMAHGPSQRTWERKSIPADMTIARSYRRTVDTCSSRETSIGTEIFAGWTRRFPKNSSRLNDRRL
jgi:hypothetical protein